MDCSPPGFSVHGIFQARILEWIAISFSRGTSQTRDPTHVSCLCCTDCQVGSLPPHHLMPPLTMFFTWSEHLCSRAAQGTQWDGVQTGKPRGPMAQDSCWGPLAFKSQLRTRLRTMALTVSARVLTSGLKPEKIILCFVLNSRHCEGRHAVSFSHQRSSEQ